jgi:DNA-binding MarR family transcriptional regulator
MKDSPTQDMSTKSAEPMRIIRLARLIYEGAQTKVYAGLSGEGFPEIRPAHSAIFRNIKPEGSRASELAHKAGITKQSVSYLIETLSADGFVEIIPDPSDGRARLVRLTRRGNGALAALNRLSQAAEADFMACLSADRARALRSDLERIIAVMSAQDSGQTQ